VQFSPACRDEFFLWMDDDFVVEKTTDLEHLVEIIENTGYDVIAGVLEKDDDSWAKFNNFDITR